MKKIAVLFLLVLLTSCGPVPNSETEQVEQKQTNMWEVVGVSGLQCLDIYMPVTHILVMKKCYDIDNKFYSCTAVENNSSEDNEQEE